MDMKQDQQPKQQSKQTAQPMKPDRSRHMSWGNDDVDHHGPKTPTGHQLKSFKKWKAENT